VVDLRSNQEDIELDDTQIRALLQPCVEGAKPLDNKRMFTVGFDQIAENGFSLGFGMHPSNGRTTNMLNNGGTHAQ
jgi:hypothetical protein